MEITNFEYAGFWKRFAATIIDGVIVIYFSATLKWLMSDMINSRSYFNHDFERSQNITFIIWSFYLFFIRWSYFAGMESSPLKATIGKMAVGIYVVDQNGGRVSFGQASGRFFGKILSGSLIGIGYLMAGFTEKKQALHDQLSNSLVLQK